MAGVLGDENPFSVLNYRMLFSLLCTSIFFLPGAVPNSSKFVKI